MKERMKEGMKERIKERMNERMKKRKLFSSRRSMSHGCLSRHARLVNPSPIFLRINIRQKQRKSAENNIVEKKLTDR
jgi:hypothetical protein